MDEAIRFLLQAFWEGRVSPEALGNLRAWLTDDAFSEFRPEILDRIRARAWTELEDCFYTTIPFGTGGRRGPRGIGPNRINARTIAESARGLANWVARQGEEACRRGIVIACDTRHASEEFARVSARAIAAAGVRVFLFEGYRPTPELSFAVRHLGAKAGIVISASHNPPTDNGFKAYGEDGGQVLPPDDVAIMREVQRLAVGAIPLADAGAGPAGEAIRTVGEEVDRAYLDALSAVTLTSSRKVRLVFTPLHGTGSRSLLPALGRAGFEDVHVVREQNVADGDFPTVPNGIPNPEVPAALERARLEAERLDADLAMATDPDADRLGCVVRRTRAERSEWLPMNGNQIGSILCHFVLTELTRRNRLRGDGVVVKTAVTTGLIDRIADGFGVGRVSELLVGFKYIGCVIKHLDDPDRFLFGLEESHGYLSRPYSRDKDGANAGLLLAEAAARAREEGTDLWGVLDGIYRRYGYYGEYLENYVRPGKSGQQEIAAMMRNLRERPPVSLAGLPVTRVVDRLREEVRSPDGTAVEPLEPIRDPATGVPIAQLRLAKDNLMIFHLGEEGGREGARVAVRPSGTEPKCKFYVSAHDRIPEGADDEGMTEVKRRTEARIRTLRDDILRCAIEGITAGE